MLITAWGLRTAELRPASGVLLRTLVLSPRSGGKFCLNLTSAEIQELRAVLDGGPV